MRLSLDEIAAKTGFVELFNMYVEEDAEYPTSVSFKSMPGWRTYANPIQGQGRGGVVHNDTLIVIVGNQVLRITKGGGFQTIGNIQTDEGQCSLASNGFEVMIADGADMWRYNGSSLSKPAMPFGDGPTKVVFHDGFFITFDPGTGTFYISESFDGSTWNALQFATAEDKPDNILDLSSDRLLWIFGEYTTQGYDNTSASFPFRPNFQARMFYGILGNTAEQLGNTTYWLGRSRHGGIAVYRIKGFTPEVVSTGKYEREWNSLPDKDRALSTTFTWKKHEFYILTFPESRKSYAYDVQFNKWIRVGEYRDEFATFIEFPFFSMWYFDGKVIGQNRSGALYELTEETMAHGDQEGVRDIILHLPKSGEVGNARTVVTELFLDVEAGEHTPDVNPIIMMSPSDDRGQSFNHWINCTFGRAGQNTTRCRWVRLGSSYLRAFKIRVSDNFNWIIRGGGIW